MFPPDDPFLLDLNGFGIPIAIRWYGALIVGGAMLAAWIGGRRAKARGYDPEHSWNILLLGMVLGIIGARAYYVAFEWPSFQNRSFFEIINPATGGLAIHGALIGAIAAALIYTRRNKLPFVEWVDILLPTVLIGQAAGRWGNFFNQEAYGRPTDLGFGVKIAPEHRLPPYNDMNTYGPDTLFHATFLYESVWNLVGFGLIVAIERRFKSWLRTGDSALMYAIWYGAGRFWVEGLRTDSLCTNGIGGSCEDALRTAQVVSILLFAGGIIGMIINHLRRPPAPAAPVAADNASDTGTAVEFLPAGEDDKPVGGQPTEAPPESRPSSP
jgi:phosphatidylglycerol:prolipoprotein diacylglycerol transferase